MARVQAPRSAVAVLAAMMLLPSLAGPVGASFTGPGAEGPARVAVAFGELPQRLAEGGTFLGAPVLRLDPALRFAVVLAPEADAFLERAARAPGVRFAERDPVLPLLAGYAPRDPMYADQDALRLVGAPEAWEVVRGSPDLRVCVADSGLRAGHEELTDAYVGGWDFVEQDAVPQDAHGHGTAASGVLAAAMDNGKGIAGMAQVGLLHARVLDEEGRGPWSTIASGIRWCVDQGARVVSLSLGGLFGSGLLKEAVDDARDRGAFVVAAAGNEGSCPLTGCVLYPARYDSVVAVGCVTDAKRRCSFSSTGPEVEIAAPGIDLPATGAHHDRGYVTFSGTSASTPLVAGAAALLLAARPAWSPDDLRAALAGNAEDLGEQGRDSSYGHGMLRVDRAMPDDRTKGDEGLNRVVRSALGLLG